MKYEHSIDIDAPASKVWETLADVPGAADVDRLGIDRRMGR